MHQKQSEKKTMGKGQRGHNAQYGKGASGSKGTVKLPITHDGKTVLAEFSKDALAWKTYTGPGAKNCLQITTVDGTHFAIRNTRRGQSYARATKDELQAFVNGISKDFGIVAQS